MTTARQHAEAASRYADDAGSLVDRINAGEADDFQARRFETSSRMALVHSAAAQALAATGAR